MELKVIRCPRDDLALTNLIFLNPIDFKNEKGMALITINEFPFTCKSLNEVPIGFIATGLMHRRWALLSLNELVTVKFIKEKEYCSSILIEVSPLKKSLMKYPPIDSSKLISLFVNNFINHIFSIDQVFAFDYQGLTLQLKVQDLEALSLNKNKIKSCILTKETEIIFLSLNNSGVSIVGAQSGTTKKMQTLLKPDFQFQSLGIGGLDQEFGSIFRRAFASRLFPPELVVKLGIQHVKGILLFGPPGTGKTLIARQIGKLLNAVEPKIVNGPEILNKYVGQSEENIRALFKDAEIEYKEKGIESELHIIIFDELDAICKQRGSTGGGTGVGDSVVNQLLSKLDGVDQLENILVIGMTNRVDMIDDALLRPGRLEVHMEISLPDLEGRQQILAIHTEKMRENKVLDHDVDLMELSTLTKNFSGAEIAGLVKSASSFGFNRHIKIENKKEQKEKVNVNELENLKINQVDFLNALDEVKPSFGVNELDLESNFRNGIIKFSPSVQFILDEMKLLIQQIDKSDRIPIISALLHGSSGSGKTGLASYIALKSQFPFIQLITPELMIGLNEIQKINKINQIFNNSYKSPLSFILIDNLERILDFSIIGPRFSNLVLQSLLVLIKKAPPQGKKLLVMVTTSQLQVCDLLECRSDFNVEFLVPNLSTTKELLEVYNELSSLKPEVGVAFSEWLNKQNSDKLPRAIPIKSFILWMEMAAQDTISPLDKLIEKCDSWFILVD